MLAVVIAGLEPAENMREDVCTRSWTMHGGSRSSLNVSNKQDAFFYIQAHLGSIFKHNRDNWYTLLIEGGMLYEPMYEFF